MLGEFLMALCPIESMSPLLVHLPAKCSRSSVVFTVTHLTRTSTCVPAALHQMLRTMGTFVDGLHVRSPFSYQEYDALVSISNGVVVDKTVNADKIYKVGKATVEVMTGCNYADIKLKHKDRVYLH